MQELLPRVESGTETESNAYVHGWTVVEQCRSNCRGAIVEERLPRPVSIYQESMD